MPGLSLSHRYITYCRKKGILFVAIDHKRPLSDQGPFDIVLHKLTGKGWQQLLEVGYPKFVETTSKVSV